MVVTLNIATLEPNDLVAIWYFMQPPIRLSPEHVFFVKSYFGNLPLIRIQEPDAGNKPIIHSFKLDVFDRGGFWNWLSEPCVLGGLLLLED